MEEKLREAIQSLLNFYYCTLPGHREHVLEAMDYAMDIDPETFYRHLDFLESYVGKSEKEL